MVMIQAERDCVLFCEVCVERSSKWLSSDCVLCYVRVEADETVERRAHNTT